MEHGRFGIARRSIFGEMPGIVHPFTPSESQFISSTVSNSTFGEREVPSTEESATATFETITNANKMKPFIFNSI